MPIDRESPRRDPIGPVVMYQNWNDLTFLHWPVPIDALRPLIPDALTIDRFDGQAFVGLVPFRMSGVRPRGLPALPGLSEFPETNVRTYVYDANGTPGVWFFSLDAANAIAVELARRWFHLPYFRARMSVDARPEGRITYQSERVDPRGRPAQSALRVRPVGSLRTASPASLEFFLLERYVLFTRDGQGRLKEGRVQHPPYTYQNAMLENLEETQLQAQGITRPEEAPLVHYSPGVRVRIGPLRAPRSTSQ
jgi:uncharacterized protein YqjF (DUF2071 family)